MTGGRQRLELTWIGKDQRPRLEPRILLEDEARSWHAPHRVSDDDRFDNLLIFGDNLLALKALEQEYAGRVKCIYIDPPYNTGTAFEHYDDGIEHSLWLSLMRDRLELMHRLLRQDGCLFVQVDDHEGHYLKVICDEIFGRQNFIATFLWRKVDSPNDNKVSVTPDHEFIFGYTKSADRADLRQRPDATLLDAYRGPDEAGRYFRDRLLRKNGKNSLRTDRPTMWFPVPGPDGQDVYPIHDDGREGRWALGRSAVADLLVKNEIIWKDRGTADTIKWVPYTREFAADIPSRPFPTLWTDLPTTRQTKAHQKELFGIGNEFATPKPEALIERILQVCTSPGDLVLDSFAGSGTTGAVAHKMNRRWIMVELGEHCHTHIIPRLRKVIDGTDAGGITAAVGWRGGGGFRYCRLAPTLILQDPFGRPVINQEYDAARLAQAMCRLMGFTYAPGDRYWQQGRANEADYLYATTQTLDQAALAALAEEVGERRSLLICCASFLGSAEGFGNLTMRKIPRAVLDKCEWGKDDYSLSIRTLPPAPAVTAQDATPAPGPTPPAPHKPRSRRAKESASDGLPLFGTGDEDI